MESMESFMARAKQATGHAFHLIPVGEETDMCPGLCPGGLVRAETLATHPRWVVVRVNPRTYSRTKGEGWTRETLVSVPSDFRRIRRKHEDRLSVRWSEGQCHISFGEMWATVARDVVQNWGGPSAWHWYRRACAIRGLLVISGLEKAAVNWHEASGLFRDADGETPDWRP